MNRLDSKQWKSPICNAVIEYISKCVDKWIPAIINGKLQLSELNPILFATIRSDSMFHSKLSYAIKEPFSTSNISFIINDDIKNRNIMWCMEHNQFTIATASYTDCFLTGTYNRQVIEFDIILYYDKECKKLQLKCNEHKDVNKREEQTSIPFEQFMIAFIDFSNPELENCFQKIEFIIT